MGGKNMTMTEVVSARRLGVCDETAALAPGRIDRRNLLHTARPTKL
jgi:hypothetical protein